MQKSDNKRRSRCDPAMFFDNLLRLIFKLSSEPCEADKTCAQEVDGCWYRNFIGNIVNRCRATEVDFNFLEIC